MNRNVPTRVKTQYLTLWPSRLDQDLRKRFGDGLCPHTGFNKDKRMYVTEFELAYATDKGIMPDVLGYIEGFQAAISMVVE